MLVTLCMAFLYRIPTETARQTPSSVMNSSKSWFVFIRRVLWRLEQECEGFSAAVIGFLWLLLGRFLGQKLSDRLALDIEVLDHPATVFHAHRGV